MRSSNPVFSRRGFSHDGGTAGYGAQPQAGGAATATGGNPYAQAGGSNPYAANPYAPEGQQQGEWAPYAAAAGTRMTMDDVVSRTGMTLGLVVLAAVASWITLDGASSSGLGVGVAAGLIGFVLAMVQSFKRKPVPALILAYAVFEGVFLGAISEYFNTYFGSGGAMTGVVMQAVIGTMAVFAGVLVAYKQRWIRVTGRFQRYVIGAAIGFILLMAVNSLVALFAGGDGMGLRSGGLGIAFGVLGVILGACFLALDFKQVEDGIAYGAPREEAWLAAFGLTMTLVWLYTELLRLFSLLQGDD
ncbi:Bax inhibitor-1/YccA family protein [Streptomyces polyrhachis]|uniref:Bax inhibitor-1/YccA family protein n=1 Tax=Streptomyces polyrhachis TaxID=1282885 RepID=A0ABW2GNS2_9ACTN